jgi:hypothetical protein
MIVLWFIIQIHFQFALAEAPFVLKVGEYQKYDVRYFSIYLGSLQFQVEEKTTMHHRTVYKCKLFIDSNPSLPFVNIHDIYYTYLDSAGLYSHQFIAYERKGKDTIYTFYDVDHEKRRIAIRIEKWKPQGKQMVLDSVVVFPQGINRVFDSLSLLYFARYASVTRKSEDVTVFAYNKFSTTRIEFTGELRKFKHGDLTYNKGYYLFGKMKFVGIAGVKDDFKGWFSIDRQRIPLRAYMKAFIGRVSVELDRWEIWEGEHIYTRGMASEKNEANFVAD